MRWTRGCGLCRCKYPELPELRAPASCSGYGHTMPADDLGVLSVELRAQARVDPNGEASWHVRDAPAVLTQLADAGRVVLGLDMRDYDNDGSFIEVAWSVYPGADPLEARDAALDALGRGELPGEWVLITWRSVADALVDEMRLHMAEPFPDSVEKGLDYGEVDAVMIGADIYGWATQAGSLSELDLARLLQAADELQRSIVAFPSDAQPYYERILHIARLALAV